MFISITGHIDKVFLKREKTILHETSWTKMTKITNFYFAIEKTEKKWNCSKLSPELIFKLQLKSHKYLL